jgi:hypothetical protein
MAFRFLPAGASRNRSAPAKSLTAVTAKVLCTSKVLAPPPKTTSSSTSKCRDDDVAGPVRIRFGPETEYIKATALFASFADRQSDPPSLKIITKPATLPKFFAAGLRRNVSWPAPANSLTTVAAATDSTS